MFALGQVLGQTEVLPVLGFVSLVLGILAGLGGLAWPSVSRKSLRATIDVLLIQKEVSDSALSEKTSECERLKGQVDVLLALRDRQVSAAIIKELINEGYLEARRRADGESRRGSATPS